MTLMGQAVNRIKALHEQNYLHRDIKPENMVMGLGAMLKRLYLIDFGLST
jgi:serine/threonine protein kinase